MIELLSDPAVWASLLTLTVMEIVLGIDNIIFISVIVARLEPKTAKRARQIQRSMRSRSAASKSRARSALRLR